MSLFKKKQKPTEQPSLPDLPDLPDFPSMNDLSDFSGSETQDIKPMTSNLPKLPSQTSIGSPTLPDKPLKSYKNLPQPPYPQAYFPLTKEVSSGKEEVTSDLQPNRIGVARTDMPRTFELEAGEIREEPIMGKLPPPKLAASKSEPVFVKIDKYQAAIQAFHEIKSQLEEIESYLREIRNLKQQEESELASWEQEIETIKTRLNNIDQGVFGKLG